MIMNSPAMFNQVGGRITHVPFLGHRFGGHGVGRRERKSASVLESLYWLTTGWVHTPAFVAARMDSESHVDVPKSTAEAEKYRIHAKKSFEPKLQIEEKVPYSALPREVAVDIEKRRFFEQDFKDILKELGIETAVILPSVVVGGSAIVISKGRCPEGVPPHPFLDLDLFDDASYFDDYSPDEWLSLGDTDDERKPLPAVAFVPIRESPVAECMDFDWCEVSVRDYDEEKRLYSVRRPGNQNADGEPEELWVPRIYVKFDAEEPRKFAERLQSALRARHVVEESLRMCYYVECMPLEPSPQWCQDDLVVVVATARRSRFLRAKLQWINDRLAKNLQEMQLEYTRAYNYVCYTEVALQAPDLVKCFRSESLAVCEDRYSISKVVRGDPFNVLFENFRRRTFFTSGEVLRALSDVESNVSALRDRSLFSLQSDDIRSLEKFEKDQRTELDKVSKYVRGKWMWDISYAVVSNLENCSEKQYSLDQSDPHAFRLTKLGRFVKLVDLKMQDVIRFLVSESLEKFASGICECCSNVVGIGDDFVWTDSLCSDAFAPPGRRNPVFEVPLELKGNRLRFLVDLRKYGEAVRDLFEEGLRVAIGLPGIERSVMRKMLHDPLEHILGSVGENEEQVLLWRMDIDRGNFLSLSEILENGTASKRLVKF